MEDDLKARMDKDLKNKMDRLFLMKLQPALYLSQRIDEIVSTIDYSAEQRLDNERSWEKTSYSTYFNQARCEMIRIVKAVEKNLHNQLLADEPTRRRADPTFMALQARVDEFQSTPFSSEDNGNDLDDSYVQLALEIIEMSDTQERWIFGGQTIFYLISPYFFGSGNQIGRLFHLTNDFLTTEQIEYIR